MIHRIVGDRSVYKIGNEIFTAVEQNRGNQIEWDSMLDPLCLPPEMLSAEMELYEQLEVTNKTTRNLRKKMEEVEHHPYFEWRLFESTRRSRFVGDKVDTTTLADGWQQVLGARPWSDLERLFLLSPLMGDDLNLRHYFWECHVNGTEELPAVRLVPRANGESEQREDFYSWLRRIGVKQEDLTHEQLIGHYQAMRPSPHELSWGRVIYERPSKASVPANATPKTPIEPEKLTQGVDISMRRAARSLFKETIPDEPEDNPQPDDPEESTEESLEEYMEENPQDL